MARKTSKNNNLLSNVRKDTSPKIYSLLVELINDNREDLAEIVLKIDYLLTYTSKCIRDKDYKEAREALKMAYDRIDILDNERANTTYLKHLYEGIKTKCK
ncbi:hypothetical protein [Clostridium sp.]|uniref:hypothetical protein n=1 Tax=Clostridium sp. TaxID=1506 RepID=UPI00260FF400|nr:hypothetical protein [Clostridium sp.]